ncbi:hypothetical protein [Streptomyces sp. NPDC007172]|uniref:hypothetical protein n=1 Tax=Streptomyces sp. NPDC007172 TaxID=3364776 RepID=UPI0036813FC6
MASEKNDSATPPTRASCHVADQAPHALRGFDSAGGVWVRQELAHGNFEAWHLFRRDSVGSASVQLFVQPVEGGDPAAIARGITTTVLRDVAPADAAEAARLSHRAREAVKYPLAEQVDALLTSSSKPTDQYLAAIALRYERLADTGNRAPVRRLVEITGRSQGTIKAHIQLARKRGFLESVGAKAGGKVTEAAYDALGVSRPTGSQ